MYLTEDEVVNMFQSGHTLIEIQKADKESPRLEEIAQLLIRVGIWEEVKKLPRRTRKDLNVVDICCLYNQHYTLADIARQHQTTSVTIKSILIHEGVFSPKPKIKLTEADKREMCLQYRHGASLQTLGVRFYCTAPTITRILREREIPLRKRGRPVMFEADEQKLRKMYESGVCVAELAQEYKVPEPQIRGALKRAGTVMRAVGTKGAFSNRFKTW